MSFVSCRVEVVVGQDLLLPLQVLGITAEDPPVTLPFNDCRFMELKLSLADNAIFNVSLETKIGMYVKVEIIFCILEPYILITLNMYIVYCGYICIYIYIVYCGYTCTCTIHCVLWLHMYMYMYTLCIVVAQR